ncbi:Transcriptional regulator, TetR family [Pseudomonas cichorii]|uniref:Transcriptional regulator, TetR family n=1 Tax=Pseudomonas cichorii TaxID=36746 RepID=A0A3M4M0I6_PSECI|nr:helix-turn-helix domain-containing protein [Pseudomonas cichorii]RMQ47217.1 Transcriptional regulator, TetR family [Pseudomonas cichorii]
MKTRDLAKQAVRKQIALTALKLFQENGYEKTTVEDISSEIGMSTRTYFRYFRSKDDVLLEPTQLFRLSFLESFERHLRTHDLWSALNFSLNESTLGCTELNQDLSPSSIQATIRSTPALLARQLEITERLQIEATDMYLQHASQETPLKWCTANAIVRTGFACLHAIQCKPAGDDSQSALQALMEDLRPILLAERQTES